MDKEVLEIALKEAGETILTKANEQVSSKGFATKEELKGLATEESLKKEIKSITDEINVKFSEQTRFTQKNIDKSLVELLQEKATELKNMQDNSQANIKLELKAAGTMGLGNISGGTNLITSFEPGITGIPRTAPWISRALPTSNINKPYFAYAEMKNPDGGAGLTAEGTAKTQADFDIVEASQKVEKVTAYMKVSKEALDDIESLAGDIRNELITLVEVKADTQVLSGTGTTPEIKGLMTWATTYACPTALVDYYALNGSNERDALYSAMLQVKIAEVQSGHPAGFIPDTLVLHPTDLAKLKLKKDTTGNYVFGGTYNENFENVAILENPRMTSGSFLVMDSSRASYKIREGVTVSIGYESDDFVKNLVTVLAEKRHTLVVKSNHAKAFVTGTFAAAKLALEAAS